MKTTVLLPLLFSSALAVAAPADAWLHVKVDNTEGNREHVRVNVPLGLAEKVLPAIQVNKMHSGKVAIGHNNVSVDPKTLLDAVRSTADGVFVTVESDDQNVRVAKERGYLLVKVTPGAAPKDASKDQTNRHHKPENVDVRIPMDVVEALLSGGRDEIDILAGIKALAAHHDTTLVTVTDRTQSVRIWVDTKNTGD